MDRKRAKTADNEEGGGSKDYERLYYVASDYR